VQGRIVSHTKLHGVTQRNTVIIRISAVTTSNLAIFLLYQ